MLKFHQISQLTTTGFLSESVGPLCTTATASPMRRTQIANDFMIFPSISHFIPNFKIFFKILSTFSCVSGNFRESNRPACFCVDNLIRNGDSICDLKTKVLSLQYRREV